MQYLFQLGHSPSLASREVAAILIGQGIKFQKQRINSEILLISTKQNLEVDYLMATLGGTIRIAQLVENVSLSTNKQELVQNVSQILTYKLARSYQQQKIEFAVSSFSPQLSQSELASNIKHLLQTESIPARFLKNDHGFVSPIKFKSKTIEFIIISVDNQLSIFKTEAITNVRDWQFRDRKRPNVDAESGILPPKVARMLVNLAIHQPESDIRILDAFCGSGTILMEALLLGYSVIGMDISQKAVEATRANLAWLKQHYPDIKSSQIEIADSTQRTPSDLGIKPVDALVSEGYLGPSNFNAEEIPRIVESLTNLYKKSLVNLATWIKPGGKLVIALPDFSTPVSDQMHQVLIDTCREAGYTFSVKPLNYGHIGARVKRKIYILDR